MKFETHQYKFNLAYKLFLTHRDKKNYLSVNNSVFNFETTMFGTKKLKKETIKIKKINLTDKTGIKEVYSSFLLSEIL